MLRIMFEERTSGPTIKLEGQLVGPWVREFYTYWQSIRKSETRNNIWVDVNAVTAIDGHGKALLHHVHQAGGLLLASGCWTRAIVEEVTSCCE